MNKKLNYSYYLVFTALVYASLANAGVVFNNKLIEISSIDQFNSYINQPNSAVFVDFGAPWCAACTKTKPIVQKLCLRPEFANIYFLYVNTDNNPQLTQQFNIHAIPTFCYFFNGALRDQETGAKPGSTTGGFENHVIAQFKKHFPTIMSNVNIDESDEIQETTEVVQNYEPENPEMTTLTTYESTTTTNDADEESNILVKISAFFAGIFMKIKDAIMSLIDTIRSWFI